MHPFPSRILDNFLLFIDLAVSKALRPLLRSRVSSDRISQSFFKQLVHDTNSIFGNNVAIYVKSSELGHFLSKEKIPAGVRIVVAGGADLDFDCNTFKDFDFPENVTFFIQHWDCSESDHVKLLPIGVEDISRARNGLNWHFTKGKRRAKKVSEILVGPFKITDPSRMQLAKTLLGLPRIKLLENRKASFIYSSLASKHRFILCPRGAGIDTHRLWESLYRGSIPIVLNSNWSRTLSNYGLPIIQVDSWEQIRFIDLDNYDDVQVQNLNYLSTAWWAKRFEFLVRQVNI
jgi:hypothetical protein